MMMKILRKVCVLILSDNDEYNIEKTIQSVKNQTYENTFIAVVDNKSADKTYEKAAAFVGKKFAIFQLKEKVVEDDIIQKSVEILARWNEIMSYIVIIKPGYILFPDYIMHCMNLLKKNKYKQSMIISEVDIQNKEVKIYNQIPLYKKDCIIKYLILRAERKLYGYRHNILGMYAFSHFHAAFRGNRRLNMEFQSTTDWINTPAKDVIYSRKKAAIININSCLSVKEKLLKDYLFILNEFNSFPQLDLYNKENQIKIKFNFNDEQLKILMKMNISKRALYFAAMALCHNNFKEASDGLLIAEMIYDNIINEKEYQHIKNALDSKKAIEYDLINSLFSSGENRRPPKSKPSKK